jgi:hypothetical protein
MLPNELKIYIYEYCCSPTKVLLNKVFKWNFYTFNPLQNCIKFRKENHPLTFWFNSNQNLALPLIALRNVRNRNRNINVIPDEIRTPIKFITIYPHY